MSSRANFFDLFELPEQLPVDRQQLTAHYQQLQRRYHPDNFATADDTTRLAMLQHSATINQAYQTLNDPLLSAEYLLSLQGIVIDAEKNIIHDSEFLLQQFELREALAHIEAQHSDKQQAELDTFSQQIAQTWQSTYDTLIANLHHAAWQPALTQINRLRYLNKLQHDIDKLDEALFAD